MHGWYGVDLDATLAKYTSYAGATHIGEPIATMVNRVKGWLAEGITVKIMTARVNPKNKDAEVAREAIKQWTLKHIGQELESTCEKDYGMIKIYDDRAVQVIANTGEIIERSPK